MKVKSINCMAFKSCGYVLEMAIKNFEYKLTKVTTFLLFFNPMPFAVTVIICLEQGPSLYPL